MKIGEKTRKNLPDNMSTRTIKIRPANPKPTMITLKQKILTH